MPRSEARIRVTIWDDPDFLALDPLLQRIYLWAISQKDMEYSGVMALRMKRLAKTAGCSQADLLDQMRKMDATRFFVLDEESEELCVRSMIRRDEVYRQPYTLKSAVKHIRTVESERIREALLAEIERILTEAEYKALTPITSVPYLFEASDWLRQSLHLGSRPLPKLTESTSSGSPENGISDGIGDAIADPIPDAIGEGIADGIGDAKGEGEGEGDKGTVRTTPASEARKRAAAKKTTKSKTDRGTRIPENFAETVTPEMIAWAKAQCPQVNRQRETERFVNYWLNRTGQAALGKRWDLAWRNWFIKSQGDAEDRAARLGEHLTRDTPREAARCTVRFHEAEPADACGLCASERAGGGGAA